MKRPTEIANRFLPLLVVSLGATSCFEEGGMSPLPPEGPGRHCALSGTVFRLGSDDALASPDEKPGWTRFAHDVWLDTTEMTQAEYQSLRGSNPSKARGETLPVTNVSWYDALLAANARSRRDGLDSVYEYSSVLDDGSGNASGLSGLSIHLDRSGWRLPTEAEWEAAARAGTTTPWIWGDLTDSVQAGASAWYQVNAGGTPHPVATKSPNAWGLYDMAGNVMEWVNDWKGAFPKDTVQDYAGPEAPGDVAEVPLKGGAYNYGVSHLRPSSRTATYAAYRSARAEYVGFRLARGGFAARYTSPSGEVVYTPPVTLARTDVARLTGSWEARLVFVNRSGGKGTLTWIDYGETNPVARSLADKDPVFHPAISPDGRWVAWSTVLEGSTQPGRIKARRLARNDTVVLDLGEGAIPRWWVNGTDTFLVRSSALDNLASGWSGTRTTARRWSNGTLPGAEETWVPSGSYHDGRSGRYLYTGYRRLRQWDMTSKTSRVLFTAPGNGKDAGDTSQVCNVSAAPDTSGRVLFLDFGFAGTSSVVGRSYGIHEVAFVADASGTIRRQIVSPASEAQWEHMEWSNASRWAASGSIDRTGAYRNLYLVDVDSGTSTRIVGGEELWQPALWVGESSTVPAEWRDSIGRYDVPVEVEGYQEIMAQKLVMALRNLDQVEIAVLGSSRLFTGIDPLSFTSGKAWNLASETGPLALADTIARRYLIPHAPNLKAVILDAHTGWMMWRKCDGTCQGLAGSKGYRFDLAHPEIKPSSRTHQGALKARSWSISSMLDERGGFPLPDKNWGDAHPPTGFPDFEGNDRDTGNAVWKWSLGAMDRLASALGERGIAFVVVVPPQSPAYRNTEYSGFAQPVWAVNDLLLGQLRGMLANHPNAIFHDADRNGTHDYASNEFWNESHLTTSGAKKLSRRLDSLLLEHWKSR